VKTVLCFGDSNTWGYNPTTKDRYPRDVRWTGVLRRELGDEYLVIEEGLNGRTTVWDDPIEGHKNGRDYLIPCLETHRPTDVVVLFLGVNDLKKRFSVSAFDIANSVGVLVDIIRASAAGPNGAAPQVLVLAPPPVGKLTEFADMFEGAEEKSRKLGGQYRRMAAEKGVELLDTSGVIASSDLDGIHFEAAEHRKLGEALAERVRQLA
jgi:lysophospholipase L1-like esterase